jgi:hypothetical protein
MCSASGSTSRNLFRVSEVANHACAGTDHQRDPTLHGNAGKEELLAVRLEARAFLVLWNTTGVVDRTSTAGTRRRLLQ